MDNFPLPADTTGITDAISRTSDAVELAKSAMESQPGTDLAISGGGEAVDMKRRFAAQYGSLTAARSTALVAAEEAKAEIKRVRDAADAMIRAAEADLRAKMAELEPVLKQAERLKDGIAALNLYLGRDEHIETLRTGEPAPADTPVHIRQLVVAMDEESALAAENGGIDFRDVALFDEWLLADPKNLDQVIPDQKGIVAAIARRSMVDYGEPWTNMVMNEKNHETWWLIRNGENLYRMTINEFNVGSRLIPRADEFTAMFERTGYDGKKYALEPGSRDWLKAEEIADLRTRHFMKIAMVLQGLVARTPILHPLPTPDLNLLEQAAYDDGFVRLIADDENALGTGRPDFHTWLKEKNANLRVGLRVVGGYSARTYREGEEDAVHPSTASAPKSATLQIINRELPDGRLSFSYKRTDKVWGRYGETTPKTSASYRFSRSATDVLAVDFCTAEEIAYYLESRSERRSYLKMFPVLRAALALIRDEEEQEAPFRDLITAELMKRHNLDQADAHTLMQELVIWWKTANKWGRPLNGDQDAEAKAARVILAEAKRRAASTGTSNEDVLVASLVEQHPDAIVVARRTNDYVVVERIRREWSHENDEGNTWHHTAVPGNVFVNVHTVSKAGKVTGTKEWTTVNRAQIAKWVILHQADVWDSWNIDAKVKDWLTDEQITDLILEPVLAKIIDGGGTPLLVSMNHKQPSSHRFIEGHIHYLPAGFGEGDLLPRHFTTPSAWFTYGRNGALYVDAHPTQKSWAGGWNREYERPWEGHSEARQIVWQDEPAIVSTEKHRDAWAMLDKVRTANERTTEALIDSINDGYRDRVIAAEKQKFMDDFHDDTLWEGHLSTLTIKAPRDQRWTGPSWDQKRTWGELWGAVSAAVAAGRDLHGLTVAEAFGAEAAAAFPDDLAELRFAEASE